MRGMIKRTLVASIAVLVSGVASAPVQAGGSVSAHGGFNPGGFQHMGTQQLGTQHLGTQHLGTQPLVRPGQMPPLAVSPARGAINRMRSVEFARRRHFFGFDVPFAGIGVYGEPDEPVYVGGIDQPLPPPVLEEPAPWNRSVASVCQTETRTVPSETGGGGGQHTIHITRCWH